MAGLRPLLLLVGLAAAIAAGVGVALWSQKPSMTVLYTDLDNAGANEVVAALRQANIPNEYDGRALLVPAERVVEAHMLLAERGISAGEQSAADEGSSFGVSQLEEQRRNHQALEKRIEGTIRVMRQVKNVQVVLALPQQSAFVRDRMDPSAAVTVEIKPGFRLDREAVASIVDRVAYGVPGLSADNVTVVDSNGRLLSTPDKNSEFALRAQQLEIAQRIEETYAQRIEKLLTPLLGAGRVHAEVSAQIQMSSTEEAREQYGPDSQVVRSEQTSEQTSRNGAGPLGVPGALTNQPPQGGTALPPGAAPPTVTAASIAPGADAQAAAAASAAVPPDNTSREEARNYEIDRTVAYTRQPAGQLERLFVAVVIDNLRSTDASGTVTETPLTPEQIAQYTTLVRDAVGFDEARGDRVSVVNQSFLPVAAPEEPEFEGTPILENPLVITVAKVVGGLLALALLLLFVVRPLISNLLAGSKAMAPMQMALPAGMQAAMGELLNAPGGKPGANMAYEQQIAQARSLVNKDPARVAQLVRDWVQKDD
jgi:flagellar M-ring protein FliF